MRRLVSITLLFVCTVTMSLASASTLIDNVRGYTLNDKGELIRFKRILINHGKVISLDPSSVPNKATVINAQNAVMMPGLIDAHGHLLGLGGNLLEVDLRDSKSMSQAAQWVADYALAHMDQDWIKGRGWNQELWSDRAFPRQKRWTKSLLTSLFG